MFAATPRRKQAKPQRLANTSGDEESPVVPSKRSRNAPLSIEEQFQKQLSQAHFLYKAKKKPSAARLNGSADNKSPTTNENSAEFVDEDHEETSTIPPSVELSSSELLATATSVSQRKEQQISIAPTKTSATTTSNNHQLATLLLPSVDAPAGLPPKILDEAGNFLLGSLNAQQLFQLYNNALSQVGAASATQQANNENADSKKSDSHPTSTTSCLLSPPTSFNDVASSTASSSSSSLLEQRFACPVAECSQHFPNGAARLLHLSHEHAEDRVLQCAACEQQFGNLRELRAHLCVHLQERCNSVEVSGGVEDEVDKREDRATSEPPNAERPWVALRLGNKDESSWSAQHPHHHNQTENERAPLLTSEQPPREATNQGLLTSVLDLGSAGLEEMGLLAMRGGDNVNATSTPTTNTNITAPNFMPTFPPTIPQFVPPSASCTPPRGRQFTPEDDWEAMMEVSNIDETEKIRALVGDKALPVTDPNQCLLCRRVLSCKSALQMHYRTHTGERPFKCKICQRAFTTKGNLKTHMGVHRAKHSSLRGLTPTSVSSSLASPTSSSALNHQCPICQKRFFSPQLLQQHVQEHTNQLTNRPTDNPIAANFAQLFGSPDKKSPNPQQQQHHIQTPQQMSSMMSANGHQFPFPQLPFLAPGFMQFGAAGMNPFLPAANPAAMAHFAQALMQKQQQQQQQREEAISSAARESESLMRNGQDLLASIGLPPPFKMPRMGEETANERSAVEEPNGRDSADEEQLAHKTPQHSLRQQSSTPGGPPKLDDQLQRLTQSVEPDIQPRQPSNIPSTSQSPKAESSISPTTSKTKSEENPLEAIQKMWAAAEPSPPTRPPIQLSKHQCAVCFKHFSSSSALQIHTRTHTGDKPFKCDVCSRAFTTRGNLKVHMSTHSYQTSPSRRGRRIFDFGAESLMRMAQGGNPFASPSSQPGTPSALTPFAFPPSLGAGANPSAMGFPPFLAAMMAAGGAKLPNGESAATSDISPNSAAVDGAAQAQMQAMLWLFKTVCSVCQKVCASPAELQDHLKQHMEEGASVAAEAKENTSN